MTNAEKFKEVFSKEPDRFVCPLSYEECGECKYNGKIGHAKCWWEAEWGAESEAKNEEYYQKLGRIVDNLFIISNEEGRTKS